MRSKLKSLGTLVCLCAMLLAGVSPPSAADTTGNRPQARQTAEWLRDAVVYEIYPRSFSASGDFKGVIPQLDRLKALGVTVIWLMPIHPIGKLKAKGPLGSPYSVRDYDAVNPEFGTPSDLKQLVNAAHARGLKVFIDIVANHTSWDSVLIKKHPEWFKKDSAGRIVPPNPDWVDVAQLDYSNPGLRQYMNTMLVRWLRDYGIDGFRCDYASGVPTDFWEEARREWDKVRPGMAFLAEADDPALLKSAFDIDYAWDFYHVVADAAAGKVPASEVRAVWERAAAKYPSGALRLRFSDNHDQLRTTAQVGLPAAMAASALMFTLDGVPLLYNGMEVGDTTESAAPALFERAPILWSMAERRPDVAPYYQSLAEMRRANSVLTRGEVRWLRNDDEKRVLSFERHGAGGESLVVVVNFSSQPFAGAIQAGAGQFKDITPRASGTAGTPAALTLKPWETRVFRKAGP
jgi:cyclomaltodextrinase / maltogenic alpha-amylase / neopullulanase